MFFGAADPDDYVVKIASVNYGVTITNYSYVTFDNLDFEGFNYSAFYLTTCPHITIQNCTFNFMGYNAVDGYTSAGSANTAAGLVFSGNVVSDVGSNGVDTDEPFTTMTISNNTFNNLGVIAGQGYKRWIDTDSAVVFGARANDNINTVVEYNTITNAGYCGVYWYGDRATIRYNFINYFSTLLDDGGAIYTYDNVATTRTGTVTYNICLNGTGNTEGRPSSNMYSYGLYTDGSTVGIDLTHNTVAYISHAGYLTNSNLNGSLEDNTFYSCQNGIWVAGTGSMSGMTILRNIMFARTSTQYTAMFNFSGSPLASTTLDYNIYTRPISETTTIYHPSSTTVSLATWKSTTGDDVHSATAGRTVSSSVDDVQIHFRYNNTTSNQTYVLSATMYDPFGVGYTNPFILAPFTSKILLGAGTVTLYAAPEPIVVLTTSVTAGYNQATVGGNVIDEGSSSITERGVCWGMSVNPTTSGSHTASGSGLGVYYVLITELNPSTTYHARAYAINGSGTAYGDDISFTTSGGTFPPTVITTAISNIQQTTATSGGNVSSQGSTLVTARGVCWSTSTNPTIALATKTSDGTGTGLFVSSLTGLTAGTHYYVRAYATNSIGTGYGSQLEFTTAAADNIPSVTTASIGNITATYATGGGNVTDDGGDAVTARGVCWATTTTPDTGDNITTNGTGEGIFTSNITGLSEGVTYYVRAYATNSVGTGYGGQVSFVATDNIDPPPVNLEGDYVFINGKILMVGDKIVIIK